MQIATVRKLHGYNNIRKKNVTTDEQGYFIMI